MDLVERAEPTGVGTFKCLDFRHLCVYIHTHIYTHVHTCAHTHTVLSPSSLQISDPGGDTKTVLNFSAAAHIRKCEYGKGKIKEQKMKLGKRQRKMEMGMKERGGQERAREKRRRRETGGDRKRLGSNEVVWSVSFLSLIFKHLPREPAAFLTEVGGKALGGGLALGVLVLAEPLLGPTQASLKSRHLKVSTPVCSAISTKSISIKLSLLTVIEKLMIS